MEENKETIVQNNEESTGAEAGPESKAPEAVPGNTADDDIQYTFVVPKGEVYREPEPPVYAPTGLPEGDDIVYTFVVPKGEVYKEPEEEDVPSAAEAQPGTDNVSEKSAPAETIIAERLHAGEDGSDGGDAPAEDGAPAETIVVQKDDRVKKTRYGLPVDHPEMGELARKQEARLRFKESRKNRFRTRFYVITASVILII